MMRRHSHNRASTITTRARATPRDAFATSGPSVVGRNDLGHADAELTVDGNDVTAAMTVPFAKNLDGIAGTVIELDDRARTETQELVDRTPRSSDDDAQFGLDVGEDPERWTAAPAPGAAPVSETCRSRCCSRYVT